MNFNKQILYSIYLAFFPFFLILGNASLNFYFLFSCIIFIYELIKFKKKKLDFFLKENDFLLIIFFLLIFLVSAVNNFSFDLILILRFLFFYFFIKLIFINEFINLKIFLNIIFIFFIFVLFDTLFQYFFGFDIFGFKISINHSGRLTGPFGDEPIPGSFIVSFMFIVFYFNNNYFTNKYFGYLLLFLALLTILLTGEKISFLMSLLGLFLLLIFNLYRLNFLHIIYTLIVFSIICYLIIENNPILYARYLELFSYLNSDIFFKSQYIHHFLTSYMMVIDFPLLGIGHDNFKNLCKLDTYEKFKTIFLHLRCANHVHNLHFQIISSYGIITYLIFIYFTFYNLLKFFSFKIKDRAPIFIQLFILVIPLKTTGDIFSSWYGSLFWFSLSFLFFMLRYSNSSNQNN